MSPRAPILVMGVAGSGKSQLGAHLASALGARFVDADDHHSPDARAKMAAGQALTDQDRAPWLAALNALLRVDPGTVLACSALKQVYRAQLGQGLTPSLKFIFLNAAPELIADRLARRADHFFPAALAHSQFAALEPPDADALWLDAGAPLADNCARALAWLAA